MRKQILAITCFLFSLIAAEAQSDFEAKYSEFRDKVVGRYSSFRDSCNQKYADFLRTSWEWYEGKAPLPLPKDKKPVPPRPYEGDNGDVPIAVTPVKVDPIVPAPQPKPVEPIRETPTPPAESFTVKFYGQQCQIRLPQCAKIRLYDCSTNSIANSWEKLSGKEMNNAIRDCLETRIRYNLCDWAYLMFLYDLGRQFCNDSNSATLLTAYLYCQSGYKMRLAVDGDKLMLLYGSKHLVFDHGYFVIDGESFYTIEKPSNSIKICNAAFDGETPMSLLIATEQLLGSDMSDERTIASKRYTDLAASSQVSQNLIKFYDTYPTSALDGNAMTRWAMYANTPLAQKTKDILYPSLRKAIDGKSNLEAANMLLNWVQTGFVYGYDNKIWGHDRAFFAEETLYYPYCDREDRSILYSRLIRDLLGLDVALIYYPGHLATAVCFNEDVHGDKMIIEGRKFVICDPTYIGAPVGSQMPDLEYDKAEALVLQ